MNFAGSISGGAPVIKKFMASATLSTAGIPVVGAGDAGASNLGGIVAITADAASAEVVGLTLDTSGTIAATGVTADADLFVSAIVNPDAIIKCRMSGSATAGTALTIAPTTAASDGTVTTGVTTIDSGLVWGYDGANAGSFRRADDTAGSVTINFVNAIAQGDNFLIAVGFPGFTGSTTDAFFDLTTDLTEADAETTNSDNDNFVIIDVELGDESDDGSNASFYHLIANAHAFGSSEAT